MCLVRDSPSVWVPQDGGQELIRQLTSQVAYLQDELEASHATNHKLLEASVGPRYATQTHAISYLQSDHFITSHIWYLQSLRFITPYYTTLLLVTCTPVLTNHRGFMCIGQQCDVTQDTTEDG
jgi:hypothetical protein